MSATRSLPLLLGVTACGLDGSSDPGSTRDLAPTPVIVDLTVEPGLVVKLLVGAEVTGAEPGAQVRLLGSTRGAGAGPCLPSLPGSPCLDLRQPFVLAQGVADAQGRVAMTFRPDASLRGDLWLQAGVVGSVGAGTSQVEHRLVGPTGTDTDGDGLRDLDEAERGLDRFAWDSDADGLGDGDELARGTSPFDPDTDADGVLDGTEVVVWGTDPLLADTDDDGLGDGAEVWVHGTDPLDDDTDGDAALDGREVDVGLDPLDDDTDSDGRIDGVDYLPLAAGPLDTFTLDEAQVSAPGLSMPDPEFDPVSQRVAWQTLEGEEVWVADIDPLTGAFVPADGRGVLVDTDVGPISAGRNGPEWVQTDLGAELVYVVEDGSTWRLARATERSPGDWWAEVMPGRTKGVSPIGSLDVGDPAARVRYVFETPDGDYLLGWRELDRPATEFRLDTTLRFARWVPGERVINGASKVNGVDQIVLYDIDSDRYRQVTFDPTDKTSSFFWDAPELGGTRVFLVARGVIPNEPDEIAVYRDDGAGGWIEHKVITMPPGYPFVVSPEPFTWDGRSYISFLASQGARNFDNGDSTVWVASIDPADPYPRLISDPQPVERKDPEPYGGGAEPWIYYTELLPGGDREIRRTAPGVDVPFPR